MSKKVFFKIIVPNYNNMPYIKKCLDSILNQSFQDFFIVIADDLSTDMSDKFCETYERKFPDKIKFIRLEKKGYAGAARNRALEWDGIESEYIWFIDSDDWIYNNNVLQKMYDKIIQLNYPDLLRCDAIFLRKQNIKQHMKAYKDINQIARSGQCPPWYNCIKSCFSNIKFIENRAKNNDIIWFARLLDTIDSNKIAQLEQPCIVYNTLSITSCQNSINKNSTIFNNAQHMSKIDLEKYKPLKKWTQIFKNVVLKNIFAKIS